MKATILYPSAWFALYLFAAYRPPSMSCTPSKHDLAAFFGSSESRSSKTSSVNVDVSHGTNGLLRESFIKSNQSLIMKIHQLEAKIRNSNKTIDELREENALLKKKLCDRENMDDSDLVDALIEERIKRKLHKLRIISTRTITYLQKAALNLKEAVEDFGLVLAPEAETLSHEDIRPTTLKGKQCFVNSESLEVSAALDEVEVLAQVSYA
uniref:HAP1 N-terminal domain-containing protein n=1 Tax=Angiostrongylus cantonensis TaxID=6313 RepID=A0A0K0D9H5_ANGCA